MGDGKSEEKPDEHNFFKDTLEHCYTTTIPNCRDAVHEGAGSPADRIATPLGDGGWECAEADAWVTELREQCNGILDAFDDAIDEVRRACNNEPEQVPAGDHRGSSWPRTWSMHQRMAI